MAQKNRADLGVIISTNLPDNATELITPLKHREVEDDLKDSNYNLLDDNASDVNYTPLVSADWNVTIPTEVKGGLDQLASRVRDIEEAPAVQYIIQLYANTDSTVSNIFPITAPIDLLNENKSSKVTAVSYETSTDGGDTWTAWANFTALDSYLSGASGFIFVRAIFTFLGGYIGEQAITLNYTNL